MEKHFIKQEVPIHKPCKIEADYLIRACSVVIVKAEQLLLKTENASRRYPETESSGASSHAAKANSAPPWKKESNMDQNQQEKAENSWINSPFAEKLYNPVWINMLPLPEIKIVLQRCDKAEFNREFNDQTISRVKHGTGLDGITSSKQKCKIVMDSEPKASSGPGRPKCPLCNSTFKNKWNLNAHIALIHPEAEFQCRFCTEKHKTLLLVEKHEQVTHPDKTMGISSRIRCEYCFKKFKSRQALYNHRVLHTGVNPWNCKYCTKTFSCLQSLQQHEQRKHVDKVPAGRYSEKKWKRRLCSASFHEKAKITEHEQVHIGIKLHTCRFCPAQFHRRNNKQSHEKHRHSDEFPGGREALLVHKCDECSKAFMTKSELKNHTRRVHTSDPVTKEALKKHECCYCLEKFFTKGEHNIHRLTHTGEKPFECQVCYLSFQTSQWLKVHHAKNHMVDMEQIQRILKYECKFCSKRFESKNGQIAHERIHTGEKPFKCDMCSKFYCKKSYFKTHKSRCENRSKIISNRTY